METWSQEEPTKETPMVSGTSLPDSTLLTNNSKSNGRTDPPDIPPSTPQSLAEEPLEPSSFHQVSKPSPLEDSPRPLDVQFVSLHFMLEDPDQSTHKSLTPNKALERSRFMFTLCVLLLLFCKLKVEFYY